MIKNIELVLSPELASDESSIRNVVIDKLRISKNSDIEIVIKKKSIDARSRNPVILLSLEVFIDQLPQAATPYKKELKPVESVSGKVIIIGAGPAGYFAALELIEHGIKPVILDRGKDVRSRRKDLRAIQQLGIVNPDSNYCFGEGGAGTYSDGKLYTKSHKRGDISKTLKILVEHGAKSDILYESHPHIGSNKLPSVVQNIRQTILEFGGEIFFDSKVTDFIINNDSCKGVVVNDREEHFGDAVLLATGHSARDIFAILNARNVRLEFKPFAIGVRAEHPQELIDEIRYRMKPRSQYLPPASYKLATQVLGKGVYSFCMCPGGLIVPASTSPGELVVNGMSMSRRDSRFANSGIVVSVDEEDVKGYLDHREFRGLAYQGKVEQDFFNAGDGSQKAPAQRIIDFISKSKSDKVGATSYIPGIYGYDLSQLLPESISRRLRIGLKEFDKKMKGYISDEALLVGSETRTSSPVRIPRDKNTFCHVEIKRLYPCGEGAGYAGGIISAALDGQNCARAIAAELNS